jgi:hypothetical protein
VELEEEDAAPAKLESDSTTATIAASTTIRIASRRTPANSPYSTTGISLISGVLSMSGRG